MNMEKCACKNPPSSSLQSKRKLRNFISDELFDQVSKSVIQRNNLIQGCIYKLENKDFEKTAQKFYSFPNQSLTISNDFHLPRSLYQFT